MEKIKWAVVGGGHAGQAIAGTLGLQGHDVKLYDVFQDLVDAINEKGGITMQDDLNGFAPITLASTDMKEVLTADRQYVAVVLPTAFYASVAEKCAPYLKDDQIVLLFPESTLGAYDFWKKAKASGCEANFIPVAVNQLIYCCRAWDKGLVNVNGHKDYVGIAAIPASKTDYVLKEMKPFFPQMVGMKDALESSFSNYQGIVHPLPIVLNVARIEQKEPWNFYFDGVSPAVAKYMEKMDEERIAVAKAYGYDMPDCIELYKGMYSYCHGETLHDMIHSCMPYGKIKGQSDLGTRYLYEDLPYSLIPVIALGQLAGVPTPYMEGFRQFAYLLLGEYMDEGRNFESLGFDKMTKEEFLKEIRGE